MSKRFLVIGHFFFWSFHMKQPSRLVILALTIALLSFFAVKATVNYRYSSYLTTPVDKDSTARISFSVEQGETAKTIAKHLMELDVIPSKWAFYKYVKNNGMGEKLQAGKYVLKKSYTIPEIADILTLGKNPEIVLTIREGLSLEEVDRYLAENRILPESSFLSCAKTCPIEENFSFLHSRPEGASLEGYLFPDTYFIDPETVTPKSLVMRMLRNFDEKLTSELRSEIAKQGYSIHQIVTMAALIEKESNSKDEKTIIAGILWKRYREKMILGVDAAVRYALQKWTGPLTVTDLEVNSPYNIRKRVGLPPGPISNFGIDSLRAAIMPKETPFYYYLHDNEGKVHFAKTNDEHNLNKAKYIE